MTEPIETTPAPHPLWIPPPLVNLPAEAANEPLSPDDLPPARPDHADDEARASRGE